MEQVEISFAEAPSKDPSSGFLGEHARWDPGRPGWSSWRKKGWRTGVHSAEWHSEGCSDLQFSKAVEASPLLDDDALVLLSIGGEVGEDDCCVRTTRALRGCVGPTVSLNLQEKAMIVVQLLQMYGLLVLISETKYMLPAQWRNSVAWTQLTIGFSTSTQLDFTVHGQSSHALIIVLAPCVVGACYGGFWLYLKLKLRDRFRNRAVFERVILTVGQLLYLPVAVAVVRLVSCRRSGPLGLDFSCDQLSGSCSSTVECSSLGHLLSITVAIIATAVLILGIPFGVQWAVKHGVIHEHSARHLQHLKLREAERLLGLSNQWENFHFHVFSSFRRKQARFKIRTMIIMCWMAVTTVLLGPNITVINSSADSGLRMAQILCFTVGVFVDLGADLLWGLPFRCNSSNCVLIALKLNLFTTSLYAALRGMELTNTFLSDQKISEFLKYQSLAVGSFVFVAWVYSIFWQLWPTSLTSLRAEIEESEGILLSIRQSRALLARYEFGAQEFVDLEAIEKQISSNQVHLQAQSMFLPTLHAVLEQLVNLKQTSSRKSYMRLRSLRNATATFRQHLDARDKALMFLPRSRKMILLKLLAIRFLIGDRRLEPLIRVEDNHTK